MASTTLFAPQVRAVQPAFVYDLKYKITTDATAQASKKYFLLINNSYVLQKNLTSFESDKTYYEPDTEESSAFIKIYFNLSSYNVANDDVDTILYTIIDPNKASTWGQNSVISTAAAPIGYLKYDFSDATYNTQTGEYYIEIDFLDDDNIDIFDILTKNQFYQVQLYFAKGCVDTTPTAGGKVTQDWLNKNKDKISLGSQATLIRPIAPIKAISLENPINSASVYDLALIKGSIQYDSNADEIETIDTCWVTIDDTYTTKKIKNQLGLGFEIPVDIPSLTTGNHTIKIFYTTKYGYERQPSSSDSNFTILDFSGEDFEEDQITTLESGVKIDVSSGKLQRKEFSQSHWVTLTDSLSAAYFDYTIENENIYEYRIINSSEPNYKTADNAPKIVSFEDIYLLDKDTMLAIRYNPNISGLKYVTQEAITNTLGGKYPVIRKNGDTRYRQFNLSGALYLNASEYAIDDEDKVTSVSTQNWSDFFDHLGEKTSLYIKDLTRLKAYSTKDRLERQTRDIAISFLTNNSIKLFRSPTEGNMIVYLSGVSFTPNKKIMNGNIYDFSCTVTEVCECNMENIKKYNLNDGGEFKEAVKSVSPLTLTSVTSIPSSDTSTPEEEEI